MNWEWIDIEETQSTNDDAKKLLRKAVISAKSQSKGRGRRGRSWESLSGNLFMSLSLPYDLKDIGKLVLVVGLSVAETITFLGNVKTLLKWPNDVLLNGKKVSGILLEKGEEEFIIVGIGVNIVASPKIKGLIYPATSLKEEGIDTDRVSFLNNFLKKFDANLALDFVSIKEKWLNIAKGLNEEIVIKDEEKERRGKFVGLDDNGMLLLKTEDRIEKIYNGDLSYEE